MNLKPEEFITPVGRLVMGDCFTGSDTDADGNPRVVKTGPNAGKPWVQFMIGLAIQKTDPGWPEFEQKLLTIAKSSFPGNQAANGPITNPHFAYKVIDGDSDQPNKNGVAPSSKEGYPGCWVVKFTSGYAPTVVSKGGQSIIFDTKAVKRGYYVRVIGRITSNKSQQSPGVHINMSVIELIGYGEEIQTGPDYKAMVAAAPAPTLPAGVSSVPLAPSEAPIVTQATGFSTPPPAPPVAPPAPPVAPVAPAAESKYPYNGVEYTAGQLASFGWTPEQIEALKK